MAENPAGELPSDADAEGVPPNFESIPAQPEGKSDPSDRQSDQSESRSDRLPHAPEGEVGNSIPEANDAEDDSIGEPDAPLLCRDRPSRADEAMEEGEPPQAATQQDAPPSSAVPYQQHQQVRHRVVNAAAEQEQKHKRGYGSFHTADLGNESGSGSRSGSGSGAAGSRTSFGIDSGPQSQPSLFESIMHHAQNNALTITLILCSCAFLALAAHLHNADLARADDSTHRPIQPPSPVSYDPVKCRDSVDDDKIWDELRKALPRDSVFLPGDRGYKKRSAMLIESLSTSRPIAVVRCLKPEHVSEVVKFARRHSLCVSPRSSGAAMAQTTVFDNRITIDLKDMNYVYYDNSTKTVVAQAGVNMEQMVDFSHKMNLFTSWGGCPQPSVASYYTGGGDSFMSPLLGMGVDVVMEYGIVLADGSAVLANKYTHRDLFWALKGGMGMGPQFGIVTSVRLKMFNVDWGISIPSLTVSGRADGEALANLYYEQLKNLPDTAALSISFFPGVTEDEILTNVGGWLFMNAEQARGQMAPFLRAFPNATYDFDSKDIFKASWMSFDDYGPDYPTGFWTYQSALGNELPPDAVSSLFRILGSTPPEIVNGKNGLFFFRRGGAVSKQSPEESCLAGRAVQGNYLFLGVSHKTDPTTRKTLTSFVNGLYEKIGQPYLSELKYPNYPCLDCENGLEMYYGDSLTRLKSVKRKYDPNMFFNFPQVISP